MPLRKPDDFVREGSKVFRKVPVNRAPSLEAASSLCGIGQALFDEVDALRDMRNNQYQGLEPSEQDVVYALDVVQRALPRMLEHLAH